MAKKRKTKANTGSKPNDRSLKNEAEKPTADLHDEKPMDFGGLPNRDLKKNLGCG
jgi:hypothetical protein